jgi:dipeptidase
LGVLLAIAGPAPAPACTTILIGKALTADGSVIHAHNEDMGNDAVGRLWWVPAKNHIAGEPLAVPYVELTQVPASAGYWASGNAEGAVGLGTSQQARPYDSVLVGLNEHGVAMSCNWAHSRERNMEGVGIRRYAIRQLLLERATSARHGVEILGELIERFGQADWGGLIYHLADSTEAWVVETTSHNWVARRVRDDEIRVTANRFRIGPDFDLASATLTSDALAQGWLASPEDELDFSRVYGRPERMDEAYDTMRERRVLELLRGRIGSLTPEDVFPVLRDRYEGTEYYTPPQQVPVWREDLARRPEIHRTISTNLAQSTFVAHLRGDLPVSIGAVMWYGVATPSWAGYFPLYAAGGSVPEAFSVSSPKESEHSAWWLFRRLQRAADGDYQRIYSAARTSWKGDLSAAPESQLRVESEALDLLAEGEEDEAQGLLSHWTSSQAERALRQARRLLDLALEVPTVPLSGY